MKKKRIAIFAIPVLAIILGLILVKTHCVTGLLLISVIITLIVI